MDSKALDDLLPKDLDSVSPESDADMFACENDITIIQKVVEESDNATFVPIDSVEPNVTTPVPDDNSMNSQMSGVSATTNNDTRLELTVFAPKNGNSNNHSHFSKVSAGSGSSVSTSDDLTSRSVVQQEKLFIHRKDDEEKLNDRKCARRESRSKSLTIQTTSPEVKLPVEVKSRSKSLTIQTTSPEVKLPVEVKFPVGVKLPANKELDSEFQMYMDSLKEVLNAVSMDKSKQSDSKTSVNTYSPVSEERLLELQSLDLSLIPNNVQDQAKIIADLQKAIKESRERTRRSQDLLDKLLKFSYDSNMRLLTKHAAVKDDIAKDLRYIHKEILQNTFYLSEALREEDIGKLDSPEIRNLPVQTFLQHDLIPAFKFFIYYHIMKNDEVSYLKNELSLLEMNHSALMAKKDKLEWDRDNLKYRLNRAVQRDVLFGWLFSFYFVSYCLFFFLFANFIGYSE